MILRTLVKISYQSALALTLYGVLLTAALIYWPGLSGPLVLDDFVNLAPLSDLESGVTTWRDVVSNNRSGPLGRPVSLLSFAANQVAFSGSVWWFKYVNLMLHLTGGLLVFWLSARLLSVAGARNPWGPSLIVAALWLFAPMHASTVLYVVQRMAQLAALFTLAGLLCYVIGRTRIPRNPVLGSLLIGSTFLVWTPLAILSKESGALLPVLAFVVEITFFRFRGSRHVRWGLKAAYIAVMLVPLITGSIWLLFSGSVLSAYETRDFTLTQRLLTEARVLWSYIAALLVPTGTGLGLFHDDYPISQSLFSPITTSLAIIAWAAVVLGTYLLRNSDWRIPMFGLMFYLVGHSMEGTIIPLELYFEHRSYLPSFGIFFSLVASARILQSQLQWNTASVATIAAIIVAAYAFALAQRVEAWKFWPTIILTAEAAHPKSSRLHTELASYYAEEGQLQTALSHLDRAEKLRPGKISSGIALHRLILYCAADRPPPDSVYRAAEQLRTFNQDAYTTNTAQFLSRLIADGTCTEFDATRIADILRAWVRHADGSDPAREWELHVDAARIYEHAGRLKDALEHLREAADLMPERLESRLLMLRFLIKHGQFDYASRVLKEAKRYDNHKRLDHSRMISEYEAVVGAIQRQKKLPKTN